MPDAISITPTCPRCGYDQSGDADTWADRCPVHGQCPECGTAFPWADLFDPTRQDLPWLIEHGRGVWTKAKRTIPTLWRASMPWLFWKRVGTHARPEPGAVLRWVIACCVVVFLLTTPVMTAIVALSNWGGWPPSWSRVMDAMKFATGSSFIIDTATGLIWPIAWIGSGWSFSWTVSDGTLDAFSRLFRILMGPAVLWSFVLAAVPTSRRLAKLRRAHIFRAFLYQAGAAVLVVLLLRPMIFASEVYMTSLPTDYVGAAMVALAWIWSLVWWGCAVGIGWKIRSPLLLTLGTIAAILGSIVLPIVEDSVVYMLRGF